MVLVILLYALFASLFTLSKSTLNYAEPFFLIGSRMFIAGVILLLHQFFWNRKAFRIERSHLLILFLLGFLNIYLTNIAEIWGLQHMVSAKACLIYSLSPFLSAFLAYLILRETLSLKKWLGLGIGFIGLLPIFLAPAPIETEVASFSFISLAEMALLGAVFCSVYGWILLKKAITQYQYSPLMANGISMLLGGGLALCHSYFSGESWQPLPIFDFLPFLRNTLWMCLISNIICYNLYGYLLKRHSATFMSFAGLVTPLFASLFGWIFLNETISWHFFASITLFAMGLTLFYQEELKTKHSLSS